MAEIQRIKVWDPVVRIGHWLLVGAFTLAYVTEDDFMTLHSWAGYTVFAVVLFRVFWGFIGTTHARFSDFVFSFSTVRQFLKDTFKLKAKRYIGHNPAGGLMILVMMGGLLLTAFSGMALYGATEHAGPLASWFYGSSHFMEEFLEGTHEFLANFTVVLIVVHVAGVILESMIHSENLVRSMVHGYKRAGVGDKGNNAGQG